MLRSVDEIAADRYVSDDTWKLLSEHLDRQQLMDLVFTWGLRPAGDGHQDLWPELDPGLPGVSPETEADAGDGS